MGLFSHSPRNETAMPKPKKTEEMSRPPAPKTMEEMREIMGQIWALLFEERRLRLESDKQSAKAQKEFEDLRAESEKWRAEADKWRGELKREVAAYIRESKAGTASLRRSVEGFNKRAGNFMENTGRILEREVVEKMKRKGGIGPVKGEVYGQLKKRGEYDGAVVNGETALVLEVKRALLVKDVQEFLHHRLPRFVEEFPDLAAGRKVYGALAFELEGDEGKAAKLARENGLLLVQVGARKRMKVLNPDIAELRPIAG